MAGTNEAIQSGINSTLQRRPAVANGAAGGATTTNNRYQGWKGLGTGGRIRIDRIQSDPDQPRRTFGTEADDRLAENMRVRGQFVPILVRWSAEADRYIVIDGDRRFRAAQKANIPEMICVVEDEADPDTILEMQLIANALREDVAPVEQAVAWQRLMERQGLSQRELADKLGYTVGTISKKVALLDLPEPIRQSVDAGEIKEETAYFISRVHNPAEQAEMAEQAKAGKLKRDDARERAAKSQRAEQGGAPRAKSKPVPATLMSRRFKGDGVKLEASATRAKGFDLAALLAALEAAAAEIRNETARTV